MVRKFVCISLSFLTEEVLEEKVQNMQSKVSSSEEKIEEIKIEEDRSRQSRKEAH